MKYTGKYIEINFYYKNSISNSTLVSILQDSFMGELNLLAAQKYTNNKSTQAECILPAQHNNTNLEISFS